MSVDGIEPRDSDRGEGDVSFVGRGSIPFSPGPRRGTIDRVGRTLDDEVSGFALACPAKIDDHVDEATAFGVMLVLPGSHGCGDLRGGFESSLLSPCSADRGIATALWTGIVRRSQGLADPATSGRAP